MLRVRSISDVVGTVTSAPGVPSIPQRASTPHSSPEDELAFQLKAAKILFERQFRIHPDRRFKADFYLPKPRLVVEVDGGGYVNGRHSRGKGMERDCEKSAYIAQMPARLIRVTPKHIRSGEALRWIEAV